MTQFQEHSLLYKPDLIQANLEQRKTVTRRLKGLKHVNEIPDALDIRFTDGVAHVYMDQEREQIYRIKCPYGKPGDLLYIREPHYRLGYWEQTNELTAKGYQKWKFIASQDHNTRYIGDEPTAFSKSVDKSGTIGWFKRTPLFMPKSLARQWMIIEHLGVERLQEITKTDAIDEGVQSKPRFDNDSPLRVFKNYTRDDFQVLEGYGRLSATGLPFFYEPIASFRTLIESINGQGLWKQNPWVWVIRYRTLSFDGRPSDYTIRTAREELFESLNLQSHEH